MIVGKSGVKPTATVNMFECLLNGDIPMTALTVIIYKFHKLVSSQYITVYNAFTTDVSIEHNEFVCVQVNTT